MDSVSKINIEINGTPLKDFDTITINQNMYAKDGFEIVCRYDALEKPDAFLIENSKDFLGLPIVIIVKTELEAREKDAIVFKGYVTKIQGRKSGMADKDQVIISGGSSEILLDKKPASRAFLEKTLEDIVKEVLKPYPLKSKVKPRQTQLFDYIVQYEESDFDFLQRLSIRYGEWFFFNGKEFIFGEIPDAEHSLTIGYDLEEFNYGLKVNPVKFQLFSVDSLTMDVHRYKSGSSKTDSNLNIYGKHALKQSKQLFAEEGKDYYEHLNVKETEYKNALTQVGETDEIKDAVNLTELKGISTNPFLSTGLQVMVNSKKEKSFDTIGFGRHLITSVQHRFNNLLTYQNSFTAIPAESQVPENTNPYFIKKAHNQLGMVTDNKDPKKLGRVKISFWWMEGKLSTPWIKVLTPYLHKNSGIYFVPTVNSRVLIAFEGGDIEKPYCLGNLYDEDAQPDSAWAGNTNEKNAKIHAIRTMSGNTIELHDSDGAEKITIYDKGDKNRVTLDSANSTLTIHANGNLKLNADKIEIKADSGIELSSQKKIEINALEEIKVTAQDKFSLIAIADIEFTSSQNVNFTAGKSVDLTVANSYSITVGVNTSVTSGGKLQFTAPLITIN